MKNVYIIIGLALVLLIGGAWWSRSLQNNNNSNGNSSVISTNGIHWHPELEIYIKGERQTIPQNVGLLAGHNPIHTHDDLPVIHLEFGGRVTQDDIRLGKFFDVWEKKFSSECIFNYCNGEEGTVKMFVNGELSTEFENYVMRDGDKIEIRYE